MGIKAVFIGLALILVATLTSIVTTTTTVDATCVNQYGYVGFGTANSTHGNEKADQVHFTNTCNQNKTYAGWAQDHTSNGLAMSVRYSNVIHPISGGTSYFFPASQTGTFYEFDDTNTYSTFKMCANTVTSTACSGNFNNNGY